MIVDERIITFINSLDTKNSEILEDIEREALADNVPIIRREMQSFLKVLLMVKKPMPNYFSFKVFRTPHTGNTYIQINHTPPFLLIY